MLTLNTHGASSYRLPLALRGVILGLMAAFLVDGVLNYFVRLPTLFGFNLSSLGWLLPLLLCVWILLNINSRRIGFPYWIWLPWTFWVIAYLLPSQQPYALQRSVMILTPLVVGMAVSTIHVVPSVIDRTSQWLNRYLVVFMIGVGLATGLLTTGQLAERTGFAAGSITASLLAAWYAGRYATFSSRRDLYRWALLATVPVLANARTGMLAVAITLPLTLVPWPLAKRLMSIAVLVGAGLLVFQMDRIQSKMFFSGQGTLEDAFMGVADLLSGEASTSDFATSGRLLMAQALKWGLQDHYWFGLGANASQEVTMAIGRIEHPHNDWLRLQYDYGTLGMTLFALTLMGMVWHAWALARRLPPETALYLYVGAGAFVPMAILMFTDNVILYAAWFGNLHFALLGLGYAAARDLPRARLSRLRVRWG